MKTINFQQKLSKPEIVHVRHCMVSNLKYSTKKLKAFEKCKTQDQ